MVTIRLTKAQVVVLSDLLAMASDEFENHGCNDYELENTKDNHLFIEAVEEWNVEGTGEEPYPMNSHDGKIMTHDSYLMRYFSDLLKKAAK